jgi:uncharacterized membrane protein YccC
MTSPLHAERSLRNRAIYLARQMDWLRGLRAAIALCAPMVLGDLAGIPNLGWAALGGFEAIIADTGGPYRIRMSSLATLSLGGAAGLFLGSVAGVSLVWALPVTVLFCFGWSYLAVLGQPFASAGILVQVIFICGIGAPTASWHEALTRSLLLLAGGAWAALLSLFLWPLDAYRPARAAVAACYTELASFLNSISELSGRSEQPSDPAQPLAYLEPAPDRRTRPSPALWHRLAQHHQYRVRQAVEQGWAAVAAIRAEHQSETAQGHHLVVLLEHADLLIARTVALAEHLEAQFAAQGSLCLDRSLHSLRDLRGAELFVAALLVRRQNGSAAPALAQRQQMEALPGSLACLDQSDLANRFLLAQVTESARLLETAIESAALLRLGKNTASETAIPPGSSVGHLGYVYARLAELRPGWNLARVTDQLRANFSSRSLLLRHAVRVSLVCGVDVVLIFLLNIDHGYWLLMTSLIVLQPHVSGTMRRGAERIGGTVGGGILAAVLAAALHSQMATAAVLFPLALLALAFLPVSYAVFAFFLTPTFVLAWLPWSGDWQLALVRTINTVAGACLALLAMRFLFPSFERDRAPQFLRASIAADRRYLAELAQSWRSQSRSSRPLANARRATGLAHNDTEESLERLLAENWPRRRPFAHFVAAFVTYLRRFAQSVTTLAALDGAWDWKQSAPVQSRMELLSRRLQWLEASAGTGSQPLLEPWPAPRILEALQADSPPLSPQDHPGERQLERLERQTDVLHRQLESLRQHGWIPGTPR